jgi:holliday junction DNA helicase RuvB
VAEPFLVREGLLGRTPRGRIAMPPAWEHLGLELPAHLSPDGTAPLFDVVAGDGSIGDGTGIPPL